MNNYFKVVQNLIMTFSKVVFFGKNSSIAISDLKCGAGWVFSKYKFLNRLVFKDSSHANQTRDRTAVFCPKFYNRVS